MRSRFLALIKAALSFILASSSLSAQDSFSAQWVSTVDTGVDVAGFKAVETDAADNVITVGYIRGEGTISLGNGVSLRGPGSHANNALIAKYAPDGAVVWARAVVTRSGASVFNAVAVDTEGGIYAAGYVKAVDLENEPGTFDFGGGITMTWGGKGREAALLVKYDANGRARWVKTLTGDINPTTFTSVAVDGRGNVFAAGSITCGFYGPPTGTFVTFDCGDGVTVSSGMRDFGSAAVLAKFSTSGVTQWARTVTEGVRPRNQCFTAVVTDGGEKVYAAGYVTGRSTYSFGNGVTVRGSSEAENAFLMELDGDGRPLWARSANSGPGASRFFAVAVDGTGGVYAAGQSAGAEAHIFGGVTVGAAAGLWGPAAFSALLVRYSTSGDELWGEAPFEGSLKSLAVVGRYVYAVGDASARAEIKEGKNTSVTSLNVVLSLFDIAGASLGAVTLQRSPEKPLADLKATATDREGNVYVAGSLYGEGTCAFGNGVVAEVTHAAPLRYISEDSGSAVLLKYSRR